MNIDDQKILGWVLAIIGGLISVSGIYYGYLALGTGDQDYLFHYGMRCTPLLLIGVLLLILGIRLIIHKGKR